MINSSFDLKAIVENVDYGMNIINREYRVLFMNMASRKKWNITESAPYPFTCYALLFNRSEPCPNCPLGHMDQTMENFGQIVGEINTADQANHRIKYHKIDNHQYVQTLTDVTRETELVRQVSLQSKETQAQNIILKRKRQEVETQFAFLNSVFNAIHTGIVVLDSSTELNITKANQVVSRFLNVEIDNKLTQKKCYQWFGYQQRCPGCPIENITETTNMRKLRYHQKIGDFTLTEFFAKLPDRQILLLFEDSTKRVGLLQQLKEHKEVVERQNLIFRSLLETSALIQQTEGLEELFEQALLKFSHLFSKISFGIILDGDRPTIIETAIFHGITEVEQQIIIQHTDHLLEEGIYEILSEALRNQLSDPSSTELTPSSSDWKVLPMQGKDRKVIGKLLLKGPPLDQQSYEIISIFLEQVAAVAENKLLNAQLEKLANTDSLTGVYNRGYFNRILEQAVQSSERFTHIAFSILMIDVNGLKRVNDTFGHEYGDLMIIKVAELLKEVCRKSDVITRLGGDEFVILCRSTGYEQANILLTRIREAESQTEMKCKNQEGIEENIPIRMSIGLASSEDCEANEVLKKADARMYFDKEQFYKDKEKYR